mmetsp:Transcript_51700/g.167981  ORF Transcript_51700/g.167981 Transcript_51700/m.167981 type:complete len:254 (-) Transcript_51700:143-904(-)
MRPVGPEQLPDVCQDRLSTAGDVLARQQAAPREGEEALLVRIDRQPHPGARVWPDALRESVRGHRGVAPGPTTVGAGADRGEEVVCGDLKMPSAPQDRRRLCSQPDQPHEELHTIGEDGTSDLGSPRLKGLAAAQAPVHHGTLRGEHRALAQQRDHEQQPGDPLPGRELRFPVRYLLVGSPICVHGIPVRQPAVAHRVVPIETHLGCHLVVSVHDDQRRRRLRRQLWRARPSTRARALVWLLLAALLMGALRP